MVPLMQQFQDWLQAEKHGSEQQASHALTLVMGGLPQLVPSAQLVENVLLEIGLGLDLARPASRLLSWSGRAALAASLLLVASAVLWLPALLLALSPEVGDLISLAGGLVSLVKGWFGVALSMWTFLAGVGETVAIVLATPQAILGLVLMISVGLAALRWLHSLTLHERSIYADPA